mmetsp:Transcript_90113/g.259815  ORF Transcript_90113/g.259815 Transcript_90113/m.259815 type:complete len:450 (-) Transcript_90113:83-1432(-)
MSPAMARRCLLPSLLLAAWPSEAEHPLPGMLWMAPVLNPGGFSSEAQSYAGALRDAYIAGRRPGRFGLRQFAEEHSQEFFEGLSEDGRRLLGELIGTGRKRRRWDVAVCHSTPDFWHEDGAFGWGAADPCPPKGVKYAIGRTMYETDRLPASWVPRIQKMDEVWVPSHFAVQQFVSSGVDRAKLVVVPEAVDVGFFDPSKHNPLPMEQPSEKSFRFLSVFKWEKRKGWDVLLRAYFQEFSGNDDVELLIKTQEFHSDGDYDTKAKSLIESMGSVVKTPLASYKILSNNLPSIDLPRLYRAADAFVLPTRGEGWGRPQVEAMAMGLPVIATNWSGSTEFMSEAYSLPLRIDGLEPVDPGNAPEGHRWAVPSVEHLRTLMRWAAEHREEAAAVGARAREAMVSKFSPRAIVDEHIVPRLLHFAEKAVAAREAAAAAKEAPAARHATASDEL